MRGCARTGGGALGVGAENFSLFRMERCSVRELDGGSQGALGVCSWMGGWPQAQLVCGWVKLVRNREHCCCSFPPHLVLCGCGCWRDRCLSALALHSCRLRPPCWSCAVGRRTESSSPLLCVSFSPGCASAASLVSHKDDKPSDVNGSVL